MNEKSTKRSLLTSILSLVLCLSMLVGSTFAWFTDEVASSNNIIKSGTLDVSFEYANGTEDPSAATWNDASKGSIFNYDKWEPGYTEAKHLRIKNVGTLALNWDLALVPNGEVSKLGEVIDVYYALTATQVANRLAVSNLEYAGTLTDVIRTGLSFMESSASDSYNKLDAGKEITYTLVLKMREEAGNEYQNLSIGSDFSVQLLATQRALEEDSFGSDYDENVGYDNPAELGYEVVYIHSLEDFTKFGQAVNGNTTYNGVKVANNPKVWVEVMADIDMTDAPAIQATEFAIGNGSNIVFSGVFDGNNHVISNYDVQATWTYNVSLFRTVGAGFTMKNITFDTCSATKTNNRGTGLIVGTYGDVGAITFDNVDIKNSTVNGYNQAGAYVGVVTEGALYFVDCDATNVTLTATYENPEVAMFLGSGYSHHDYEESGIWINNCTMTNCKTVINGVESNTVVEHNYVK